MKYFYSSYYNKKHYMRHQSEAGFMLLMLIGVLLAGVAMQMAKGGI